MIRCWCCKLPTHKACGCEQLICLCGRCPTHCVCKGGTAAQHQRIREGVGHKGT